MLFVSTLILVSYPALVATVPPARSLNYVDSSSGLEFPAMYSGPTELEFADVNGDGHVDIGMVGDHDSPGMSQHGITVWLGDGAGHWSARQSGYFGYGGIAFGDVNGDGLMDVGYAMHHTDPGSDFGDQLIEVALGDGTGENWIPWDDGLATSGETWGMFGTDFADVDNDGDLDIGSISFGCCAGLHVYLNNGDGTWTQSWGVLDGDAYEIFQFGDINGDGFIDFAAAHSYGTVWLGDGQGNFTVADYGLPGGVGDWREGVALGDVNGDGRDDLAFRNANGGIDVWSYVGPGVWQNLSGTLPASGNFYYTQIADMNLDGHGDIVACARGQIRVYGGDGAGNWELLTTVNIGGSGAKAFRAGVDADHNGYPDIVMVNREPNNRARFYRETTPVSSTWVYPKYPRGGEVMYAGSVRFIDWHAAVANGESTVTIELSVVGPDGPWIEIASNVPNNGRFQWHLPRHLTSSNTCYLRYTLGEAQAVTPAPFTIVGEPGMAPLSISLPEGTPEFLSPAAPTRFTVEIVSGGEAYVPGSALLHYCYDGGEFITRPLTPLGETLYQATLPAPACGDTPQFYISAVGDGGSTVYSPEGAPENVYTARVGEVGAVLVDDFETDPSCYDRGDLNCDGALNVFDIDAFVLALTDPLEYATALPYCNCKLGDINCDEAVNVFDIDPFVGCLTGGGCAPCP